ncbi:MAG: cell filamentation protein Fic [Peptococcaceae bacterium BICA1-7]|nr:MAG: cell filamentation protein Fic [Peptococcaceae bacterium BICA1-7]HBV99468.1 Fic family protein [Desulfotomaculum sp.]
MYNPRYTITNIMAQNLMKIQRASLLVENLPLPSSILELMRRESREETVLLSTKLEGNNLAEQAKREALYRKHTSDEQQEVYNLMKAIEYLDDCEERQLPITEEFIKKLHAIIRVITHGRRPRQSEYRSEQNQVGKRNESNWYLPPEPSNVPRLMEDLVAWVNSPSAQITPAPIKAGIVMWQFLTIHPYMDGNGRTARMIATYILRLGGFGLKGLFVLERFYNRNLREYYKNLQMSLHHNYYFGRNDCDISPWLEFFISGVAEVFEEAAKLVEEKSQEYTTIEPELIRVLDPNQRIVFTQLAFRYNWASTSDLRKWLNLSDRTIRDKVKRWIDSGFVMPRDNDGQRIRSIVLATEYQALAEEIRLEPERYRYLVK